MKRIAYIVFFSLAIAACGSSRTEVSTSKLAAVVTDNSPEALIAALPGAYHGVIDSPHDGGCTVKITQAQIQHALVPKLNITVTNPSAALKPIGLPLIPSARLASQDHLAVLDNLAIQQDYPSVASFVRQKQSIFVLIFSPRQRVNL